jgi:phosphonate transport system substrate-binding protein
VTVEAIRVGAYLSDRLLPFYERATAAMGEALGRPAALEPGRDFARVTGGELHAGFICGLPYVNLRDQAGEEVEALVAPVMEGDRYAGEPVYFSDVLMRADADPAPLQGLGGRRLAVNEANSHSGYGVVLATLAERGVPEQGFAEVVETGSHAASVWALREGRVDAAAVDSHLLAAFVADDPALLGELTRTDTLGPSPAQPLVAGPALGPAERLAVQEALREVEPTELAPGVVMAGWEPVDDAFYEPIRRMRDAGAARLGF